MGVRCLLTFLSQMRRLIEGGAYSSKYVIVWYSFSNSQEELESSEISNHKKLCIQLKRAEKRVLEKALKFVSTTKHKTSETRLETGRNCDNEIEERQANTTSSDVDDTTSAAEQLCINGE